MSEQAIEVFRCEQLNAWLRRATCGKQHREALRGLRVQRTGSAGVYGSPCVRCEIGKAHAKGLEPLVQVERLTAKASPPPPPKPPKKKRPAGVDHVSEVREAVRILQAVDKRKRSPRAPLTGTAQERERERWRRASAARRARWRDHSQATGEVQTCGDCQRDLSPTEQCEKRTRCRWCRYFVEHNGERKSLTELAKGTGVSANLLMHRIRKGWDIQRALEVAPRPRKKSA